MLSNQDVVSQTLLVKERGDIFEEKLASNFCLQLPSWCLCLNCRDFEPQRLVVNSDKEMLKQKRKALQNPIKSLAAIVALPKARWKHPRKNSMPKDFNLTAILMSCKSLKKVNALEIQLKATIGLFKIFMHGE